MNCNAELHGRFCHQCGQENIEPKETVWGLISHFFYDITHFDGKFFQTTGLLIKKPGFLPKEYIAGRRARYLHPIRMYVFSSALFFLLFFSVAHIDINRGSVDIDDDDLQLTSADSIAHKLDSTKNVYLKRARNSQDSAIVTKSIAATRQAIAPKPGTYRYQPKEVDSHYLQQQGGQLDTATQAGKFAADLVHDIERTTHGVKPRDTTGRKKSKRFMTINGGDVNSVEEYDSIQAALPESARDNWLERRLNRRNLELKAVYGDDDGRLISDLLNKFLHTFPYLLFVSLPLYALFLKMLYARRKQFLYTDHALWLIYLYVFTFILLTVFFLLDKMQKSLDWHWLIIPELILLGYGIWYAYKAMRKFYGQSTGKTLLKFFTLNILATISILLLFTLFFAISVFQL